jgi:hypothetical protein
VSDVLTAQTSVTPILDRILPVPARRVQPSSSPQSTRTKVYGALALASIAGSAVFLATTFAQVLAGEAPLGILLGTLIAGPLVVTFSVIVVHEIGHLIAGWSVGLRLVSIRFGPIKIAKPLRISLERSNDEDAWGLVQMIPSSLKAVQIRILIMMLGGSLANLLSALVVAHFLHFVAGADFFILMSLAVGIGNLIPFRGGKVTSDGKRILTSFRRNPSLERSIAVTQIAASMKKGLPLEDISPVAISAAIAIRDDSVLTFIAHKFAYSASWRAGPETETARLLEIALEYSGFASPTLRESVFCDAATLQATKRKNLELAHQWLAEISEAPSSRWRRLWIEAAIFEAKEDFDAALHKLDEAERTLTSGDDRTNKTTPQSFQRWRSELVEKAATSRQAVPASHLSPIVSSSSPVQSSALPQVKD